MVITIIGITFCLRAVLSEKNGPSATRETSGRAFHFHRRASAGPWQMAITHDSTIDPLCAVKKPIYYNLRANNNDTENTASSKNNCITCA